MPEAVAARRTVLTTDGFTNRRLVSCSQWTKLPPGQQALGIKFAAWWRHAVVTYTGKHQGLRPSWQLILDIG